MQGRDIREDKIIAQLRESFRKTIKDAEIKNEAGFFPNTEITSIRLSLTNLTKEQQTSLESLIHQLRTITNFCFSMTDNFIYIGNNDTNMNLYITHIAERLKAIQREQTPEEAAYTRGAAAGALFFKLPKDLGLEAGSFLDRKDGAKLAAMSKKAHETAVSEKAKLKK